MLSKQMLILLAYFGAVFQILGTALLGLFSFKGIELSENDTVRIKGKPSTAVSVNQSWVIWGKIGLIILLLGIGMAAFSTLDSLGPA